MKRYFFVSSMLTLQFVFTYAQSGSDILLSSFINQEASIRETDNVHLLLINSPLAAKNDFVYGKISFSINGIYEISLSRDVEIGSPMGWYKPSTNLIVKVNFLPQDNGRPSATLFIKSMLARQDELMCDNDLKHFYPILFQTGLQMISYRSKASEFGLAFAHVMKNRLVINFAFGVRELRWNQHWSGYLNNLNSNIPKNQDGVSLPLQERTSTKINWSAGLSFEPTDKINIVADVNVFPVIEIDNTTLLINATETLSGAFGIRYNIHPLLKFELYDRWYSSFNSVKGYHQIRCGLSSDLSF